MRIISKTALQVFAESHPDSRLGLAIWTSEVEAAEWESPADIKRHFRNASILKDSRVVFNIAGNKFRLVVVVLYQNGLILIKFVGTHDEYDHIDAQTVDWKA